MTPPGVHPSPWVRSSSQYVRVLIVYGSGEWRVWKLATANATPEPRIPRRDAQLYLQVKADSRLSFVALLWIGRPDRVDSCVFGFDGQTAYSPLMTTEISITQKCPECATPEKVSVTWTHYYQKAASGTVVQDFWMGLCPQNHSLDEVHKPR